MHEKRDIQQQDIFKAASTIFARFGFKKTSVADVADEAGMTKGNIYFYFKDKRDLYEKTVKFALQQWRDSIAESISREADAANKLAVLAKNSFEYLSSHDDLRAILISDPSIFTISSGDDRFADVNLGAMHLLRDVIIQGIKEGVFHPVNADRTAEFMFSVYIMFLIKAYVKPEGSSFEVFNEGVSLALRGLLK